MEKSNNKIYYKIGEVCEITELKPSILRFWEKQFKQLKPVKVGSKHRYYTTKHIDIIKKIKHMLYEEKLTIEGAKLKLNNSDENINNSNELIHEIKKELLEILSLFKVD
jgi:DNA-binding transcriptional MerR regulator